MEFISNDGHIGLEMVNCYAKYFDYQEKLTNDLIDKLARTNVEIKILSDVMNKLSHAKQKDKQADFSNDEMMKRSIAHIHKNNPTIFSDLIQGIPEHLSNDLASFAPGQSITVDDVLTDSLRYVDLSKISFQVMTEDEIDVIIQGIDGELKMHSADLNESMMKINEKYDNRSQMTENARQVLKQAEDFLEYINNRTAR